MQRDGVGRLDKIPCLGYGVALGKGGKRRGEEEGKGTGRGRGRGREKQKEKRKKGNTNEYPNGPSNQHEY